MTPDELPAYLKAIQSRVKHAAIPVVNALASAYEDHLVNITLTESGAHGPATRLGYPRAAPAGRPPMMMTGALRASIRRTPGTGGEVARATVSPHTIYAATQQFGGVHTGSMWLWVKYVGPRTVAHKNWVKQAVHIERHPYMDTAVDEMLAAGTLWRPGERAFSAVVWGN